MKKLFEQVKFRTSVFRTANDSFFKAIEDTVRRDSDKRIEVSDIPVRNAPVRMFLIQWPGLGDT